jgi:hypothetical protein
MKPTFLAALILTATFIAGPTSAQAPAAREEQLVALAKEVRAQQIQIADNQAKIEARLVDLAETIRVARIFAARAK